MQKDACGGQSLKEPSKVTPTTVKHRDHDPSMVDEAQELALQIDGPLASEGAAREPGTAMTVKGQPFLSRRRSGSDVHDYAEEVAADSKLQMAFNLNVIQMKSEQSIKRITDQHIKVGGATATVEHSERERPPRIAIHAIDDQGSRFHSQNSSKFNSPISKTRSNKKPYLMDLTVNNQQYIGIKDSNRSLEETQKQRQL